MCWSISSFIGASIGDDLCETWADKLPGINPLGSCYIYSGTLNQKTMKLYLYDLYQRSYSL
jgi:hypothetical protein